MPEQPDQTAPRPSEAARAGDPLAERLREVPGLTRLVAEAEATWRTRAAAAGEAVDAGQPGWRTFEDAFPTFYEFTNRPR